MLTPTTISDAMRYKDFASVDHRKQNEQQDVMTQPVNMAGKCRHDHRSQTSFTTPCNGVVSHGAQFGGLRVFADYTHKQKQKTNVFMIFARCGAFGVCLSSCTNHSTCTTIRTLRTRVILITGKPRIPLKFSPMPGSI